MEDLYRTLSWRLKEGSHDFPGPDGGTCINEAAIVAAGMAYRKVQSAEDCPPCFSRVIASYALKLNDRMPDKVRNELLLPFVTRLSGTSDTPEVEQARATFIAVATVKRILPIIQRLRGFSQLADECAKVQTLNEAREVALKAKKADAYAAAADAADAYAAAAYAAAAAAADAAYAAADAADAAAAIWKEAVQIMDEAIRMGRHDNGLNYEIAETRLSAAKEFAMQTGA